MRVRAEAGEAVFAARAADGPVRLAALVSGGREAAAGCLRAASIDGRDAITVCRSKRGPGADAERVVVEVETCQAGACEAAAGGVGDVLAIEADPRGCVVARAGRDGAARIAVRMRDA